MSPELYHIVSNSQKLLEMIVDDIKAQNLGLAYDKIEELYTNLEMEKMKMDGHLHAMAEEAGGSITIDATGGLFDETSDSE